MEVLNYKKLGQGQPLIILHGLFGSLDNWQTLAKQWSEHYEVWLLDQRNHGRSFHSQEFSYSLMAEDLNYFIQHFEIDKPIILGHSMGGKTAMEFAVNYPKKLKKLIVVDIAPVKYEVHHYAIIDALRSVDVSQLQSRSDADAILKKHIKEVGVRQFLLKNLYRTKEGGYDWRFNLTVLADEIIPISEWDITDQAYEGKTLFIKGEHSPYILEEHNSLILKKFPQSDIITIKGAGHWVHAEKAEAFYDTVSTFMKD